MRSVNFSAVFQLDTDAGFRLVFFCLNLLGFGRSQEFNPFLFQSLNQDLGVLRLVSAQRCSDINNCDFAAQAPKSLP